MVVEVGAQCSLKKGLKRMTNAEVCPTCKNEIDPDCCYCGSPLNLHGYESGHSFVPIGCTCGYAKATEPVKSISPVKSSSGK